MVEHVRIESGRKKHVSKGFGFVILKHAVSINSICTSMRTLTRKNLMACCHDDYCMLFVLQLVSILFRNLKRWETFTLENRFPRIQLYKFRFQAKLWQKLCSMTTWIPFTRSWMMRVAIELRRWTYLKYVHVQIDLLGYQWRLTMNLQLWEVRITPRWIPWWLHSKDSICGRDDQLNIFITTFACIWSGYCITEFPSSLYALSHDFAPKIWYVDEMTNCMFSSAHLHAYGVATVSWSSQVPWMRYELLKQCLPTVHNVHSLSS